MTDGSDETATDGPVEPTDSGSNGPSTAGPSVAVVGAGPAGAAVAHGLRDHAAVAVFEAAATVSGRAATASRRGCRYDYGANYVKSSDDDVSALVRGLDDGDLVDVTDPVWTFDATGSIEPGRDDDAPKWSFRQGIAELPRRLLDRAGAVVHTNARITAVERVSRGWRLADADGRDRGTWGALVLTPPAPATAGLLADADWDDPLRDDLAAACRAVQYRPVVTAALHYPFEQDRPFYGLVNADKTHPVGWLSREECKRGHVQPGESLLVVQLSPAVSAARFDDPDADLAAASADLVTALLGEARLRDPDWSAVHRFRHALPDDAVDPAPVRRAEEHDLFVAGDWVAGEGRVHLALRSGLDAADRVRSALE